MLRPVNIHPLKKQPDIFLLSYVELDISLKTPPGFISKILVSNGLMQVFHGSVLPDNHRSGPQHGPKLYFQLLGEMSFCI